MENSPSTPGEDSSARGAAETCRPLPAHPHRQPRRAVPTVLLPVDEQPPPQGATPKGYDKVRDATTVYFLFA